jgi:hypothetical protein
VGVDGSKEEAAGVTWVEVVVPEFRANPAAMSVIATTALSPATDKAMTNLIPERELMV